MTKEEYEKLQNDAFFIEMEIKSYISFFEEISKRLFELRTFDALKANELYTLIEESINKYFKSMNYADWSALYTKQLELKREFRDAKIKK